MKTTKTKTLPNIVYYNDNHSKSTKCTGSISKEIGCTWTLPSNWEQLTREIENGAEFLAFHIDMIDKSGLTAAEFVSAVHTISRFCKGVKYEPVKIMVIITPHTPLDRIKELQRLPISGLGLELSYYPVEEVARACQELVAGRSYWPEHIISQLPNIKQKPRHIYFRETKDEGKIVTQDLVEEYNQHLPVHVIMCTNWSEFEQLIANTLPYQVVLHASHMSTKNATISQMIAMIQTRLKLYNLHDVPIAMVVDRDTPLQEVESWKRLGVFGIIPFVDDKDTHSETIQGVEALTNRIPYWPQHILDQLPNPPRRLLRIYFRKDWEKHVVNVDMKRFKDKVDMDVIYCSSWDELEATLIQRPHQLTFHVDLLKGLGVTVAEIMSMLETRLKLANLSIPIAVTIDPDTPLSVVKELKKAGVFGICPSVSGFGLAESIKSIQALRDRIPYWPKHILDQLPGQPPKKVSIKTNAIHVSPRQQQVLDLIKTRGLSNKQIARALSISENTVKMHVGDIMRAYGVKSRTQLVVLS